MQVRVVSLLLLGVLTLVASCGGSGSSTGTSSGSSIANVTFATSLPNSVSLNSVKALAVTSIDQPADQRVTFRSFLDRVYASIGIRSAHATTASINGFFYLSGSSEFNRIDLLQVVDPTTGVRTSITDAALKASSSSLVPSITGFFTTPLFVIQSVKNLYKPNAAGRIDRDDSSTRCPLLAIERSTGKVACINVTPWCEELSNCGHTFGNTSIQTNGAGSLVYVQDKDQNLIRIDLSNIDSVSTTQLTDAATDGRLQSLVVNNDGDAYVNIDTGVAFQNVYRIYKRTGGTYSLNNTGLFNFVNCPFSGPASLTDSSGSNDGNNFYFADENNKYWKVSKSSGAANGFTPPTQLSNGFTLALSGGNNCSALVKDGSYAHSVPEASQNPNFVAELAYPDIVQANRTPWKIDFSSQLTRIVDLHSYSGYLIVWGKDAQGKDVLVKYTKANGATGAMSTFFNAASGYTIQKLTVNSLGELTAAVTEASTGGTYLAAIGTGALNSMTRIKQLDGALAQIGAPN